MILTYVRILALTADDTGILPPHPTPPHPHPHWILANQAAPQLNTD